MGQWWIDEPGILGSGNPTDAELERLFKEGFRTIISLLEENEQPPGYHVQDTEAMGFSRHAIPVKDFTAPTLDQFRQFLEIVDGAEGKVLIHCQGGWGRTGTMGAAYWMNKGLPAHKAIAKVRQANPGALEVPAQEDSLYALEAVMEGEG